MRLLFLLYVTLSTEFVAEDIGGGSAVQSANALADVTLNIRTLPETIQSNQKSVSTVSGLNVSY